MSEKKYQKLAFIGAGNMARSLIGGLLNRGYPAEKLACSDPSEACLIAAQKLGPIKTTHSNPDIIADADLVILAVKPQVLKNVLQPLTGLLQQGRPLLVSIAAGINSASLQQWAGDEVPIVRCMPNTPALLQQGASALYATDQVSDAQRRLAETVLSAVGIVAWVETEPTLDVVTALSGSGPAYFFLFMEAMQAVAEQLGLDTETAQRLTQQTALGAARMAIESDDDVAELRRKVTSPNGTTEAAIQSFENSQLRETVELALTAAFLRSQALAKELA